MLTLLWTNACSRWACAHQPCSDSAEFLRELGLLLNGFGKESNWRLKMDPCLDDLFESDILSDSFRLECEPVYWWLCWWAKLGSNCVRLLLPPEYCGWVFLIEPWREGALPPNGPTADRRLSLVRESSWLWLGFDLRCREVWIRFRKELCFLKVKRSDRSG